ncbi:MAG: glycosyltransferase [Actinomycetales bacterium]|nr:glycosyltransferase [Actinomycetales bacterium]
MSANPRVSIVIPAREEGEAIRPILDRVAESVTLPFECLVVVDTPQDSTVPPVASLAAADARFRVHINTLGRSPARAIRAGIEAAAAPVCVVTMADGSDDPQAIDALVRLVERGVVVAAASRYMAGGQQVGASGVKALLSRTAGLTLHWFAGVGTRDATNSFKAYRVSFIREVGINSNHGFEIGLELTAKARRARQPVAEIPTIWLERNVGVSRFRLREWLPYYLRWYLFAFGPTLTLTEIRRRATADPRHTTHPEGDR